MLSAEALDGPFGVEIKGVHLGKDRDPRTVKRIVDLVHVHHVAVIRTQHLSPAEYVAFGRYWGEPIVFFLESHRNRQFPEIIEIHNSPATPLEQREYAMHWHTDGSYQKQPASVTLLHAVEAPRSGGETLFVDMAAAYEALSAETRAAIENLQVKHFVNAGARDEDEGKVATVTFAEDELRKVEPPIQPLVMRHPITGRKALYAVAGSAYGIVGMGDDEGKALLAQLKRHATQERFRLTVKANAGDILIWDNFATMHTATKLDYSDEDGKRRRLWRISVTGLPRLFREEQTEFSDLTP